MDTAEKLDLSGLKCPVPLLRAKKKLGELGDGVCLEVIATDPHSEEDFRRYCDGTICSVVKIDRQGKSLSILIRKGASAYE